MKRSAIAVLLTVWASGSLAFTTQHYLNDNAEQALRGFQILSAQSQASRGLLGQKLPLNGLQEKRAKTFSAGTQQYSTSYYQYYHGVRVMDGEITVHELKKPNAGQRAVPQKKVIGQLLQDIEIDPRELDALNTPANLQTALADAKAYFLQKQTQQHWDIKNDKANLVIKKEDGKLVPLYETLFYATAQNHAPVLYHALIDPAQKNKVIKAWNDVMHYTDSGPGGNSKTQEYHYGVDGIPALEVNKKVFGCELRDVNANLVVVNMSKKSPSSPFYDNYMTPFRYTCASEDRDLVPTFGAYSPADDAYIFGHLVQQTYQNWYQTKVLDLPQMTLRVHYRFDADEPMENAFWDPVSQTMNFGDGSAEGVENGLYPLVSIDITSHEMSHGFTSGHSNLQYHDEPGALNEAFSDMAGAAAMAYMQQEAPKLYQAIYHTSDMVWGIGHAIMKNPDPRVAMRYFDIPSRDSLSADCYDKTRGAIANKCRISYNDVVELANYYAGDNEEVRQSIIVHLASGVYNKFFYTLSNAPGWDIKKTFGLMLVCNRDGYWGENSDFHSAACQTLAAATDLGYDTKEIKKAFNVVGIETQSCSVVPH